MGKKVNGRQFYRILEELQQLASTGVLRHKMWHIVVPPEKVTLMKPRNEVIKLHQGYGEFR